MHMLAAVLRAKRRPEGKWKENYFTESKHDRSWTNNESDATGPHKKWEEILSPPLLFHTNIRKRLQILHTVNKYYLICTVYLNLTL